MKTILMMLSLWGLVTPSGAWAAAAKASVRMSIDQAYLACRVQFWKDIGFHNGEGAFALVYEHWMEDCVARKLGRRT